jgi:hypothetical protein
MNKNQAQCRERIPLAVWPTSEIVTHLVFLAKLASRHSLRSMRPWQTTSSGKVLSHSLQRQEFAWTSCCQTRAHSQWGIPRSCYKTRFLEKDYTSTIIWTDTPKYLFREEELEMRNNYSKQTRRNVTSFLYITEFSTCVPRQFWAQMRFYIFKNTS